MGGGSPTILASVHVGALRCIGPGRNVSRRTVLRFGIDSPERAPSIFIPVTNLPRFSAAIWRPFDDTLTASRRTSPVMVQNRDGRQLVHSSTKLLATHPIHCPLIDIVCSQLMAHVVLPSPKGMHGYEMKSDKLAAIQQVQPGTSSRSELGGFP